MRKRNPHTAGADPAFRQGGGPKKWKIWIDYPLAAKQPPHAFIVPGKVLEGVSPSPKKILDFGVFEKAIFL